MKKIKGMHPSNCMIDCNEDSCSCSPTRDALIKDASRELLAAAVLALDYLKSRGLDAGQVGASLHNAISKATGRS